MINSIFNINSYYFNPYAIPYYLIGILTLCEGVFILIHNKKALVNISYMLSCLVVFFWLTGMGIVYSAKSDVIAILWAKHYAFLGIIFITPAIYFFSVCWQKLLFSDQKIKKSPVAIFNFICGFAFYLFCINSDLLIKGMWRYWWGFYPKAGAAYFILIIWFYILMMLLIYNFIEAYRKEKALLKKKQAKLMIVAFSIAFLGSIEFLPNYGIPLYLLAFIPVFVCITIVGYSVIRYRLMDIETVVHKTIAWLLTTIALVVPFVAIIHLTKPWHTNLTNIGAFSFLGVLSLLFIFFVKIFQPRIDHVFQRRHFNLVDISDRFTKELVHLKGLNKLIKRTEDIIKETLYPKQIDIYIYNEDKKVYRIANVDDRAKETVKSKSGSPFLQWLTENDKIVYKEFVDIDPAYTAIKEEVKSYFNATEAILVIPLVLNDKLLGIINLGKKANLRRYSAADSNFLVTLKNQFTIALSNSLLYENIEEQVRQRTEELVEVQKQLVHAEKLATVGTLAGGVAHEINNPLAAILTNVQMLLASGIVNDPSDKESLELIEEATKRCRNIVQKLMAYARKPIKSAEIGNVDLLSVIENVISFLGYQLGQENIKIILDARDNAYFVYGNKNELEQVITNTILNAKDAIKKIKKGGNIYVSLLEDEEWVNIKIKDEGIGIKKELISKVFDPFFTTKDVGKGVGLGLSICQAIIEGHGGAINVESEPNKGSTFTVQLPIINKTNKGEIKL